MTRHLDPMPGLTTMHSLKCGDLVDDNSEQDIPLGSRMAYFSYQKSRAE
jgi:hypothetical protein